MQNRAQAAGRWIMWLVSVTAGEATAWAMIVTPHGSTRQPGELVADTPDELRAMLPRGLTRRHDLDSAMPAYVVEVWE